MAGIELETKAAADARMTAHEGDTDPHGDRAYVDGILDDTGSADGDVLTTDGAGGFSWETPSGGGGGGVGTPGRGMWPASTLYGNQLLPTAPTSPTAWSSGNLVIVGFSGLEPTTFSEVGVSVTATSLTAGQQIHVGVWEALSDDNIGDLVASAAITVGTSTGLVYATGLTFDVPTRGYLGVLNPSGNAGSCTLARASLPPTHPILSSSLTPQAHLSTGQAALGDMTGTTLQGAWSSGPLVMVEL